MLLQFFGWREDRAAQYVEVLMEEVLVPHAIQGYPAWNLLSWQQFLALVECLRTGPMLAIATYTGQLLLVHATAHHALYQTPRLSGRLDCCLTIKQSLCMFSKTTHAKEVNSQKA